MSDKPQTIYESMKSQGYTGRDFLKFCSIMAAYPGLASTGITKVVKALETKPRMPVVWFHFQVGEEDLKSFCGRLIVKI